MTHQNARRSALKTFGLAAGTAADAASLLPGGASNLAELDPRLAAAPTAA